MRKESTALKNANSVYLELGITAKEVFHNTKLLLQKYRRVCWSFDERLDDLYQDYTFERDLLGGAELFTDLLSEPARERLERKFTTAYDSKLLIQYMDNSLLKLRDYPRRGEEYFDLLNKQYFGKYTYSEQEMLDALNVERSVYYDRKKEAIAIYSVVLWGFVLPEYRGIIWRAV